MESPSPFDGGACPACREPLETVLACVRCGALLEVEDEVNGSPFAVFGLAPTSTLDEKDLEQRLLKLGRAVHPDFYATAGEEARALAERNSALLNRAYGILGDTARRADFLVKSLGGPDEQAERQMPQEFLMEVLEWNEALEEARESTPESDERRALDGLETELRERREAALAAVQDRLTPLPEANDGALSDVRRELNAVRYLDRALGEIEELRLESTRA